MKRAVIVILLIALIMMLLVVFLSARPIDDRYIACEYLRRLGWSVSDMPETCEKIAVSGDSLTMQQYFDMQKQSGFDLSLYDGKTVVRLTYIIKNYPSDSVVYANVLVYGGKVIGGDIMTRSLDGFMKGLHKNGTT